MKCVRLKVLIRNMKTGCVVKLRASGSEPRLLGVYHVALEASAALNKELAMGDSTSSCCPPCRALPGAGTQEQSAHMVLYFKMKDY